MDLSELHEIINDIKTIDRTSIMSLKSIDNELNNIKFKMKCREETIENVKEWIMCNPCHTFPKKRHKWINTLESQRKLRRISFDCNVKELLILIKNNMPIPEHLSSLSVYIYDFLKYDDNTNELIGSYENVYVYINAFEVFNNLIDIGFLYQKYYCSRVHINKSQIRDIYNICDDSVYDDYNYDEYDMTTSMHKIINDNKKRIRDDEEEEPIFKKSRINYDNFKLTTPVFKI